jgi:hypothetical protein
VRPTERARTLCGSEDSMTHAGTNRLPVLAAEIRMAHADVQEAIKTAAQRAIEAGHALIEAKELVDHGGWMPWLREHCALPDRTARLYMQVARSGLNRQRLPIWVSRQPQRRLLSSIQTLNKCHSSNSSGGVLSNPHRP